MNKKILSMILTGSIVIGSVGITYADGENKNYPYKHNKELQEIFEVYEDADKSSDMLLSPNPISKENTEFKVKKDGSIEVKLEENITTGCTWHIEIQNDDILKVDEEEYNNINESENEKGKTICGAPGVHTWKFQALKKGVTKITFKLYQDWDPNNIYETKEYTVSIGEDGKKQIYVDPYADDENLQEIFKIYKNADKNSDLLLSPNLIAKENIEKNETNLFKKLIQFILNI